MNVALSGLTVAVSIALIPAFASARDGMSTGAAVAIGALGGLAVGGVIGSSMASGPYHPGKRVYTAPPPVYYPPPPRRVHVYEEVEPRCFVERHRYVNAYGDVIMRRERWCD